MSGYEFIVREPEKRCELCGTVTECRPYGPNGEQVCFYCAQKDPAAMQRGVNRYIFGMGNA
jgi:hypothetical protein